MEARETAKNSNKNIAQLYEEEEKKETAYRIQEEQRNARRQRGLGGQPAGGIIPAAVNENNSGNSSSGAVSGTDSESEPDTMGRMVKDLSAVQWCPRLEMKLEEILIRNAFDFKSTAKDFQRYINSSDNPDQIQTLFFRIDSRTLQLKWTDIEIRKHVIPKMQKDHQEEEEEANLEDDLPPLEKPSVKQDELLPREKQVGRVPNRDSPDRKAPSPEPVESEQTAETEEDVAAQIKAQLDIAAKRQ